MVLAADAVSLPLEETASPFVHLGQVAPNDGGVVEAVIPHAVHERVLNDDWGRLERVVHSC